MCEHNNVCLNNQGTKHYIPPKYVQKQIFSVKINSLLIFNFKVMNSTNINTKHSANRVTIDAERRE